jgi:hypothetical protein
MEKGLVRTVETAMVGRGRGRPEGLGFVEYLLVVYPHGDLQDRLMEEQQQFSSDYGLGHRLDQGQRIVRNRPHVTLAVFQAGEVTEQVYSKAMPDYSRRTFHGIFRVRELVLLRRRHSFDPCKTVNVFGLKN